MFTLRARWLVAIAGAATLAGWGIRWWVFERTLDGHDTTWLTDPDSSPRGLLFDTFVNGTHPLFPWLAFFCAGIVLGRLLDTRIGVVAVSGTGRAVEVRAERVPDAGAGSAPFGTIGWRPLVVFTGMLLFTTATVTGATATSDRAAVLLSTDPYDRGLIYVMSALGTALVAFGVIGWLADRYADVALVDALRRAGQMSLTLYLAHALVFNLIVDWLEWIRPTGLDTALLFSAGFWLVGILAAVAWQRRFGRGPAEVAYRWLTA
jgi:hypothetical protein